MAGLSESQDFVKICLIFWEGGRLYNITVSDRERDPGFPVDIYGNGKQYLQCVKTELDFVLCGRHTRLIKNTKNV